MQTARVKAWKGAGMEGPVARWYTRTRRNDMEDFRRAARTVAGGLRSGSDVLEVAPGPGFFSLELARLGDFKITGLDVSRTPCRDRQAERQEGGPEDRFSRGQRVRDAVCR